MKIVIIGSGISGLSTAIRLAELNVKSILISPFVSERSQSVMAAGGINAVLYEGDSIDLHVSDTLKGGCYIAGEKTVRNMCTRAPEIIKRLEGFGTVFSLDENGRIAQRAFGGQSRNRTCYCGSSTGKQIVTALTMEARRYEAMGMIERRLWTDFHSALIKDGRCYGAICFNEATQKMEAVLGDALVMACGGQNALFGKTTGSMSCDGYAAGRLFMQGVKLKNLEFIQYHPTTMETSQKKMLISEAVRGEGGRLYYEENGKRVYFMEDIYGEKGNLMPRDIVAREIYKTGRGVYLDITFLGKKEIEKRIPEVSDLCLKYGGFDISKKSIKVTPSVHFFMGGIAVDEFHRSNISGLYAVGECASIYHGANRLGGNSLLAANYSGVAAAENIAKTLNPYDAAAPDFGHELKEAETELARLRGGKSKFPSAYIRNMLSECMGKNLGIVRDEDRLRKGLGDIEYLLDASDKIWFDSSVLAYFNYSLKGILTLAKATLLSALNRKESRGAHFRSDCPETDDGFKTASIISYDDGRYNINYEKDN